MVVVEVVVVVGFVEVVVFFVVVKGFLVATTTASAVKPINRSSISSGNSVFTDDGIVKISGASVVFFFET